MSKDTRQPCVLVVTGPTATGKSRLSMEIARRLNGEIINADAMQVYRDMDIGTAKPDTVDRNEIPHHLYDICDLTKRFSAGEYVERATVVIRDILDRGKLPIVVGGTGMYVRSLMTGFFQEPGPVDTVADSLRASLDRAGLEYLYRMLQRVDPLLASKVSPRDTQRIIRGLTVYFSSGRRLTDLWADTTPPLPDVRFVVIGLTADREELYAAINRRVDVMMENGFLEEVRDLVEHAAPEALHAFKAIGYRELAQVIQGNMTLEAGVERIKQSTRRFAKRQLTWFRSESARWFTVDLKRGEIPVEQILNFITIKLNDTGEE